LALRCSADQETEDERLEQRAICRVLAVLTFGLTTADDRPIARHLCVQAALWTHYEHVGHLYLRSLKTLRSRQALCRQAPQQYLPEAR
jgi:hypothetical protein